MAGGTLALNVSCMEGFRICLDDNKGFPVVNMALNVKIPIHDLLSALGDFASAEAPPRPQKGAEAKPIAPPHYSGPAATPPPPPPPAPAAPAAAMATGSEGTRHNAQRAGHLQSDSKPASVTWNHAIADLQPSHEEYVRKTQWKATSSSWVLANERALLVFKPRTLEPPWRGGDARGGQQPAAPGGRRSGGGVHPAVAVPPAAAAQDGWLLGGEGAATGSSEGPKAAAAHPPPPVSPPPPPDRADAGPGEATTPPLPPPPPGLPTPPAGVPAPATHGSTPSPHGRGQPQPPGGAGSNKECKQQ